MKITITFTLEQKKDRKEKYSLFPIQEEVDMVKKCLEEGGHQVSLVKVSEKPEEFVDQLVRSEPDLIFNLARGNRETFYPRLFELLAIPFTGGDFSLFSPELDRNLLKTVVSAHGIRVPGGILITSSQQEIPSTLKYPLIIKPNSQGVGGDTLSNLIVGSEEELKGVLEEELKKNHHGLLIEEFIQGKEFVVPFLESFPGKLLGILEYDSDGGEKREEECDIHQCTEWGRRIKGIHPAELEKKERSPVMALAGRLLSVLKCPDFGRINIKMGEDGLAYFLGLNFLPSLHPAGEVVTAASSRDIEYKEVIEYILKSSIKRNKISLQVMEIITGEEEEGKTNSRPTARELGIKIGRFKPGNYNAITDVKGIRVGHVTHIEDDVKVSATGERTSLRTGITAILPAGGNVFDKHLVASGFVLNGIGEMSGLTQIMEWGWLETPILLTNTMSVGQVHSGVIRYMIQKYPQLGTKTDVIIPVIGETDDSFLNDVRLLKNTAEDAITAIEIAEGGMVQQGSVGAGTGMTTCDFAGGIGTSSRILSMEDRNYTLGVLVLSNFGKMRNLTIDGAVVGRELDKMFPQKGRRGVSYGSIIVVIATDAPLLPSQLNRICKRSALGLGRVGSHAASTSGEIIIAFSTGNRLLREEKGKMKYLNIKFISDVYINPFYEAVIEATEEAVLNAIFCSHGMRGRLGRYCPAVPHQEVLDLLRKGRDI